MSKFTFIREDSSYVGNAKQTIEFSAVVLDDILAQFEDFLKGAGFVFDGHLIIDQETFPVQFDTVNKDLNDYRMSEQEEIDIRS